MAHSPSRALADYWMLGSRYLARRGKELVLTAWGLTRARWLGLAGRHRAAITRYGKLIWRHQQPRESLATYRRIDVLLQRYPEVLPELRSPLSRAELCVFFLGHSRSGHSLVAALLDAHPDIVMAHEVDALRHLARGADFQTVARAMQHNSRFFARFGRHYTGYDYSVPGQFQGQSHDPRVLGDKKGNSATRLLRRDPGLFGRLAATWPVPVRLIHVIRNPYDNIATRALRNRTSLQWATKSYLDNVATIDAVRRREPGRVIDVYLDDLVQAPEATLRGLLGGLGIDEMPSDYLDACASVLFASPRPSRYRVDWDSRSLDAVRSAIEAYDFLLPFARSSDRAA